MPLMALAFMAEPVIDSPPNSHHWTKRSPLNAPMSLSPANSAVGAHQPRSNRQFGATVLRL